ncbi:response regulator [Pseudooceanicola sp. CBS1P-1]|uniref:Response regulator n=1 Tax=Pseudooceanicola albus TaxID=2692189 RepID=A0A6L7G664_9RHOB|nr:MULTISPECIES: response regulator [Pseudooceanicola]MBT9386038.1 response regulator [Pseudooceanicola endophyticus]MXN19541.1 response regulator [Pseudooceanicola albus]
MKTAPSEAPQGCISVIDDDPELCRSIGSLLRAMGYEVRLFGCTRDFLAAPPPGPTGCLLLDIRLSGENGLDFQEELNALPEAMPVILMTGHGDIPMTVRGMRAGAIDVLPKPFDEDQLLEAISAALEADAELRAQAALLAGLQRRYDQLTPRERQVMALVVTGLMNKQVAAHLELSEITVKIHRGNVMRKMAAQSLADLVRMAEQLGVRDATISRYSI